MMARGSSVVISGAEDRVYGTFWLCDLNGLGRELTFSRSQTGAGGRTSRMRPEPCGAVGSAFACAIGRRQICHADCPTLDEPNR
jgi:hypothetical protein